MFLPLYLKKKNSVACWIASQYGLLSSLWLFNVTSHPFPNRVDAQTPSPGFSHLSVEQIEGNHEGVFFFKKKRNLWATDIGCDFVLENVYISHVWEIIVYDQLVLIMFWFVGKQLPRKPQVDVYLNFSGSGGQNKLCICCPKKVVWGLIVASCFLELPMWQEFNPLPPQFFQCSDIEGIELSKSKCLGFNLAT